MDFFGNKARMLLIAVGVSVLGIGVVWPFLHGSGVGIQTSFKPMNAQMQELITQESKTHSRPSVKPAPTKSSKSDQEASQFNPKTTSKTANDASPSASIAPTSPTSSTSTSEESSQRTSMATPLPTPASKMTPQSNLLDLNTATLEQLDKLPGIGESKAKAILEYRLKKGRFKRIEELKDVKGIGDKMFEKLQNLVVVAPS